MWQKVTSMQLHWITWCQVIWELLCTGEMCSALKGISWISPTFQLGSFHPVHAGRVSCPPCHPKMSTVCDGECSSNCLKNWVSISLKSGSVNIEWVTRWLPPLPISQQWHWASVLPVHISPLCTARLKQTLLAAVVYQPSLCRVHLWPTAVGGEKRQAFRGWEEETRKAWETGRQAHKAQSQTRLCSWIQDYTWKVMTQCIFK